MRASTFLTVASLFLIGAYGLPQPENDDATKTIEERHFEFQGGSPSGHWHRPSDVPDHSQYHHSDGTSGGPNPDPSGTNTNETDTKIKERQAPEHFETPPDGMSWAEFKQQIKQSKKTKTGGPPPRPTNFDFTTEKYSANTNRTSGGLEDLKGSQEFSLKTTSSNNGNDNDGDNNANSDNSTTTSKPKMVKFKD